MHPIIEKIEVNGFRSLWNKQKELVVIDDLHPVNVLLGKNDAGKSNVLRALNLFFEGETDLGKPLTESDFNLAMRAARQPDQSLQIRIFFSQDFLKQHAVGRGNQRRHYDQIFCGYTGVEKKFTATAVEPTITLLGKRAMNLTSLPPKDQEGIQKILRGIHFRYVPVNRDSDFIKKYYDAEIKHYIFNAWGRGAQAKTIGELGTRLREELSSLKQVINEGFTALTSDLKAIFPEYESISLAIPDDLKELFSIFDIQVTSKRLLENAAVTPRTTKTLLGNRGSGAQARLLFALLHLIDRAPAKNHEVKHRIWGIEEPEAFLHHSLEQEMWENLASNYSNSAQIFTTSHTTSYPLLFTQPNIKPIIVRPSEKDNSTEIIDRTENLFGDTNFCNQLNKELGIPVDFADIAHQSSPIIFTEGKTDWKNLKLAKERLGEKILLQFYEYETGRATEQGSRKNQDDMGDETLGQILSTFARFGNSGPRIFLFDRDKEKVNKKYSGDPSRVFREWGNNVFSFCLPKPSFRDFDNVSIEHYFSDEKLATRDESGRRLFWGTLFNPKTKMSNDGEFIAAETSKCGTPSMIDEKVYLSNDPEGKKSVALSKNNFAEKIAPTFPPEAFEAFREIFAVIDQIIRVSATKSSQKKI